MDGDWLCCFVALLVLVHITWQRSISLTRRTLLCCGIGKIDRLHVSKHALLSSSCVVQYSLAYIVSCNTHELNERKTWGRRGKLDFLELALNRHHSVDLTGWSPLAA